MLCIGLILTLSLALGADNPEVVTKMANAAKKMEIAVAGDLQGHLIGSVSTDEGAAPVVGAEVVVSGRNPVGAWSRATKAVENGLWQVELPEGCTGGIVVTAMTSDGKSEASVDAGEITQRLTPRPDADWRRVSLDGKWDFAVDPPANWGGISESRPVHDLPAGAVKKWSSIETPSHWEMEGFVAQTGRAAYRKHVSIPLKWAGKRIKLRADGIYSKATIWVNGRKVGGHIGDTLFELDITDAVKVGRQNEIDVLVDERSFANDLDKLSFYAHCNLAGIWRPIEVFCVEPAHISRIALSTKFDGRYRDADLLVDVDVSNEQSRQLSDAEIRLSVADPAGKKLSLPGLSAKVTLGPWEWRRISLKAKATNPEQWTAETPKLYGLQAELVVADQPAAAIDLRFGFKQVEIKGRTYTINGRPVKFWGTNRLDSQPLMGRAVTPDVVKQDLTLMKGCNINAIRTSHFPTHPVVMDMADKMGFYVEDEASFIWVDTGMFGPEKTYGNDLRYAPFFISVTSALLERDRNHPCVSIWSVCNESAFGRNLAINWNWIKKSDPTRPCSAGQSANLEIATYHCPTSMQRMKDTADFKMPVLFDEGLAPFQGFGIQAYAMELDPGLRDYWVTAHFEPLRAILASEHQFGSMIWAWVDDAFLVPGKGIEYGRRGWPQAHFADRVYKMPGRGIIGDPMWGVIDSWRRPRPEWWLTKKMFSPIHIEEQPLALPKAGSPITVPVENRNTFTNLARYTVKWAIAGESGKTRADVPPMSSGTIRIAAKHQPAAKDTLILEFYDEQRRLVDAYRLAFKPHDMPKLRFSGRPAMITEPPGNLNMAKLICLTGPNSELAFDRTSGVLIRGTAGGELVLMGGPSLHVLRNDSPYEINPTGWRFTGAQTRVENGRAVLDWNGDYPNGYSGGFEISMDDAGNAEIAYRCTYTGPEIISREVGINLDLPLGFERLEWDRKAEFSYYPEDHIGRPRGVASAHPNVAQTVPPGNRPYSLDDHPWGCNDFRSTKRSIYWAAVTNAAGAGVKVISNGAQNVRATVGVNSISLKVLDYYGGSATGFNEWDGAYGNGRTIKPGDVIEGKVSIRLL